MAKRTFIVALIFLFLLTNTTLITYATDSWPVYRGNSQRSNYMPGVGNITYPVIQHSSKEAYFSAIPGPVMLIGDVCGNDFKEIVAVSEKTNSLYVFNHTLSLLWSYKVNNPQLPEKEYSQWDKISSLALGDIDGDGKDEILFSMSTDSAQETILRAFSGEGRELWNVTLEGRITKYDLLIEDINKDGKNEIIVGASNIYILNGEGDTLHIEYLNFDEFTGVTEIAMSGDNLLISIWHYSLKDLKYSASGEQSYSPDRPLYSYFNLTLFGINENLTFHTIWTHEMENTPAAYSNTYSYFYTSPSFDICYFIHWTGVTKIYINNGTMKEIVKWSAPINVECSITDESSYWIRSSSIFSLDVKNDCPRWIVNDTTSASNLFHSILFFDADNDGRYEVVTTKGHTTLIFFNGQNGDEISETKIFTKSEYSPEILIHADTDNDGFDEIITTDPEGRIVIIDNGTPPKPQESVISPELMVVGVTGAIITASAVIWIWRKRKNEKQKINL